MLTYNKIKMLAFKNGVMVNKLFPQNIITVKMSFS